MYSVLRVLLESISCFVHVKDSELSTEGFSWNPSALFSELSTEGFSWNPSVALLGLFRNLYMSRTVGFFNGIQQVLDVEINFSPDYD